MNSRFETDRLTINDYKPQAHYQIFLVYAISAVFIRKDNTSVFENSIGQKIITQRLPLNWTMA